MKSENQVEKEIIEWLIGEGWQPKRQHAGGFRNAQGAYVSIGQIGRPDWCFVRPYTHRYGVGYFELEVKAEEHIPSATNAREKRQLEKIAQLNHIGIPAAWANSLDGFKQWYYKQPFAVKRRAALTSQAQADEERSGEGRF